MNQPLLLDSSLTFNQAQEAISRAFSALRKSGGPRLSVVSMDSGTGTQTALWSDVKETMAIKVIGDSILECVYVDIEPESSVAMVRSAIEAELAFVPPETAVRAAQHWRSDPAALPRAALCAQGQAMGRIVELAAEAISQGDTAARQHGVRSAALLGGSDGRRLVEAAAENESDPDLKSRYEKLAKQL